MVVILMGVSGAGKTVVGELLAQRQGWVFYDGDDLHSPASRHKMSAGQPLSDEDRKPWLESIRRLVLEHESSGAGAVIACSALRQSYRRDLLAGTREARIVYLRGTPELIERRLRGRKDHFFDSGLLSSQFATLEEPIGALAIDVDADLGSVVAAVETALAGGSEPGRSAAAGTSEKERDQ